MIRRERWFFFKDKYTGVSGGAAILRTKKEADQLAYSHNCENSRYLCESITLTDDQLKLVTNDKSIEQFNPFLHELKTEQRNPGFVSYQVNKSNDYGRQLVSCTLTTPKKYKCFNEPDDFDSRSKNERLNKYVEKLFASSTLGELAKNCWIIYPNQVFLGAKTMVEKILKLIKLYELKYASQSEKENLLVDPAVFKQRLFSFLEPANPESKTVLLWKPEKSLKQQMDMLIPIATWHTHKEKRQAWTFFNDKTSCGNPELPSEPVCPGYRQTAAMN